MAAALAVTTALASAVAPAVATAASGAPRSSSGLASVRKAATWVAAGLKVRDASSSIGKQLPNNEYAWIPSSKCLAAAITSTSATPCIIGDTSSTTTVAVYGDSSADQWALDVAALGVTHHFRVVVYVKAACPVGNVLVELEGLSVDPTCATFRSTVLSDLASMRPAPSLVLTSELRLSNYETSTGGALTNAVWSSSLTATIDQLEKDGLAVASLHGVPITLEQPANCIAANPRAMTKCTTPRKDADPGGYDAATLAGITAAHSAAVNVQPLLCTAAGCPVVADGQLTHAGDNHVDETYSKVLEPALGELLGCIAAQHFTNRDAAARVLNDLDGAKPAASYLKGCEALAP